MTNQKVALVTGAGTGIGKASALALLNSGYQVIFVGRRQDVLETAIAQAGSLANHAQAIALDISQAEQVKDLFENVKKTYGRLDILFNNACLLYTSDAADDIL
jgi:NADP-dependent 3-hydroxy acid dehydrogenase YdfG